MGFYGNIKGVVNMCQEKYKEEKFLHTEKKIGIKKNIGRLTQRESAILTRWKSLVRIQYRPLIKSRGYGFRSVTLFVSATILLPFFSKIVFSSL